MDFMASMKSSLTKKYLKASVQWPAWYNNYLYLLHECSKRIYICYVNFLNKRDDKSFEKMLSNTVYVCSDRRLIVSELFREWMVQVFPASKEWQTTSADHLWWPSNISKEYRDYWVFILHINMDLLHYLYQCTQRISRWPRSS